MEQLAGRDGIGWGYYVFMAWVCDYGSDRGALGRVQVDWVVWGSALFGSLGMQLGLGVLVLGWGRGCLKKSSCMGLMCSLVLQYHLPWVSML